MMTSRPYCTWIVFALLAINCIARQARADSKEIADNKELVDTIVGMLTDDDKDTRAIGLEQVREKAPGKEATLHFASLLPKLKPDAQVALLAALADRGDMAAHDAVLQVVQGGNESCREAAYRALGALGGPADVTTLVAALGSKSTAEQAGAAAGLKRLAGPTINSAIVGTAKKANAALRAQLIGILADRRASDIIPDFLADAHASQAAVRSAGIDALGQLAGPQQIPALFDLALAAPDAAEREAIERALFAVCDRTVKPKQRDENRANAALAVYEKLSDDKKLAVLPTMGRLGGKKVLALAKKAIAAPDALHHAAGVAALCNWPNGSVAPLLLKLCKPGPDTAEHSMALQALIRVAPLPDNRPGAEKLAMTKAAMELATNDAERRTILRRASAIRTIETVRWVLGYFDDPALTEAACFSMVEMAHHRELRQPNKAEFQPILDRIVAISKDPVVVERAKRYKNEQTFKLEKK